MSDLTVGFSVDERDKELIAEAFSKGIRGFDAMVYAVENRDRKED